MLSFYYEYCWAPPLHKCITNICFKRFLSRCGLFVFFLYWNNCVYTYTAFDECNYNMLLNGLPPFSFFFCAIFPFLLSTTVNPQNPKKTQISKKEPVQDRVTVMGRNLGRSSSNYKFSELIFSFETNPNFADNFK